MECGRRVRRMGLEALALDVLPATGACATSMVRAKSDRWGWRMVFACLHRFAGRGFLGQSASSLASWPRRVFVALAWFASLVPLAGCAIDFDSSADPPASISDPIINGDLADVGWWNAVEITGCSAVALDEEWVLTARHCTPSLMAGIDVATRVSPREVRTIREIHRHPTDDIALLRVHPFSHVGNHIEPWNLDIEWLEGKDLYCIGRGNSTNPQTGFGTWRNATMRIGVTYTNGYAMYPNARSQIQTFGDSGGPCFYQSATTNYVTGIQSTATYTCMAGVSVCDSSTALTMTSVEQVGLSPAIGGWVKDIQQRAPLFFLNGADGVGYVSMLERNGAYTGVARVDGFTANWTHVVLLHNDALFFYDANNGIAATATLDKDGNYAGGSVIEGFYAPGYTHVVAVGKDGVFFYSLDAGQGAMARVDTKGVFTSGEALEGFLTGFTHIAGTRDGGLLFYNRNDGTAATSTVDASLHYTFVEGLYLSPGWTRVVAVDHDGLFFYNGDTGVGYTSQIDLGGHYHDHGPVYGFNPLGWWVVVGASNGGLFFLDPESGLGALARVSAGTYSFVRDLPGFRLGWSHVTAD
jgi:Trypsin